MSYSMIIAVALALVALSSSNMSPSIENNVLARFYSNFAQFYRAPTSQSFQRESQSAEQQKTTRRYQFLFTELEFEHVQQESLSMLYADVIERSIVYHPMPNFEVEGTRYFYRRDPNQMESVEIELVRPADRLVREVKRPNRYFYLSTFEGLEYARRVPQLPFYEVNFLCNSSSSHEEKSPLLSYIDTSFEWSPRYIVDAPMFGTSKKPEMIAYADLENTGLQSMMVKAAELTCGDIKMIEMSDQVPETPVTYDMTSNTVSVPTTTTPSSRFTQQLSEEGSGLYVYQLNRPSTLVLPPRSIVSIPFFEPHVNIESFFYYSSSFSPMNSKGRLCKAYNLTSPDTFMPAGNIILQEQGRFIGEMEMPDLAAGETYTMQFSYDADVAYRRRVKIVQGDEDAEMVMYNVEIMFENFKQSREILIGFTESCSAYKYFEVKNISMTNETPDLVLRGSELQGRFMVKQGTQKMISYNMVISKFKPMLHE